MRTINIADLFCGAGGSSTGAVEAAESLGYSPQLSVVNHWDKAIDTHKANHPNARHFCTGVDNINPRDIYKDEELHILMASPECTHHSTARGGRPVNEQSRATAMCVIRWAEAVRPGVMLIENVPEFRTWGPLIRKLVKPKFPSFDAWQAFRRAVALENGYAFKRGSRALYDREKERGAKAYYDWVPDPKRKGELYNAWINMIKAVGYKVEARVVCCANYGDPTTRRRLLVYCVRGKRRIVWPNPTHLEDPTSELQLMGKTWEWPTARNSVIDWSLEGKSIWERAKPLSDKTMSRIWAGFEKFGMGGFIVPQHNEHEPRSLDRPAPTVTTTSRGVKLVEPFLVNMKGKSKGASVDKPAPTVTAKSQHLMLAQPFIEPCLVKLRGTNTAASVDRPCPTVAAQGGHIALAQFIVQTDQTGGNGKYVRSLDQPAGTVITKQNSALVEPFLVQVNHGDGKEKNARHRRVKSVDKPHPSVCGSRAEFALCEPALLPQQSGGALRSVDQPAPTVAADGAIALVEPFLVKFYGTAKTASINRPLDTVTSKERFGLVRPVIEINGERYQLDIRFRMLQPHELAAAQGFRKGYKFIGNKTETVKMIGNAVPRRTVRAHIAAAISQNPDVSYLIEQEMAAAPGFDLPLIVTIKPEPSRVPLLD